MPRPAATSPILADLNEPQRRAVLHRDGPLLVLAGPGSGKTRVITRRAAQLVRSGIPPHHVLAITFTNKAADEMKRRIIELGAAGGMWIHTFHALGVRLLREFGPLGRVRPGFTIYDEADQKRVIKQALEAAEVSPDLLSPEEAAARIGWAKNELRTPGDMAEGDAGFKTRLAARVYKAYEELLEECNAVDFDDLLMRVAIVLRDRPEITRRLNERFRYVLIDEYQDTNHAQYLIARYLSQHHRNICVTGDPDQSIYGWRGADLNNILEFEHDYPDAEVVRLEQNYRSTPAVLRVASELIRCNRRRKHKDLWTERDAGDAVSIWRFAEGRDEAEHIAETIRTQHEAGAACSDFAVLYRVNAISRGLEEALRARAIPYKIARGVEFYNRKEVRDTIAYLRVLVNPADDVALLRIINTPPRGIGKTTIARLSAAAERRGVPLLEMLRHVREEPSLKKPAAKLLQFMELLDGLEQAATGSVAEAVSHVLEQTGLEEALRELDQAADEDRLANVQELVSAAQRYEEEADEPTLEEFLSRISLTSDQDVVDESAGVVLLMTLHAAKGLEFPAVFIAGVEQGMLPHERSLAGEGDIEEERRLFFVGITRAMRELYISLADERVLRGVRSARSASQFLCEIPDDAAVTERLTTKRHEPARPEGPEGFVPFDDVGEPAGSSASRAGRARSGGRSRMRRGDAFEDEPVFSPDDPTRAPLIVEPESPFKDWGPGTLVRHEQLGVGEVVWLRPGPGRTRAAIRFPRVGEKTLVLEFAPVRKLDRTSS